MKRLFYGTVMIALLAGCGQQSADKKTEQQKNETTRSVGGTRDEHGCLTSAGYVWSAVRNDCIRCFEIGVPLLPVGQTTGSAAYIVFNADSSQVELFFPDGAKNEILDRRKLPGGRYAWNIEDDDTKNVRQIHGQWIIEQRGKLLYKQVANDSIRTVFQGGDGKTRRLYRAEVTFYPQRESASLRFDDRTYELKQYVTADGYGYRNDSVNLRGKGEEATLSFTNGLTLSLQSISQK